MGDAVPATMNIIAVIFIIVAMLYMLVGSYVISGILLAISIALYVGSKKISTL